MRSSPAPSIPLPRNKHRLAHIRQRRNLAITQTDIQMLPFPFPFSTTLPKRRKNTLHSIQPRRQIRHRNTNLDRWTIPTSRQMRKPELRFDHHIEARPRAVRPCLAVPRDRGIDQARVNGREGGVVERVFFEGVGEVVLDEDVCFACEAVQDFLAPGVVEREG